MYRDKKLLKTIIFLFHFLGLNSELHWPSSLQWSIIVQKPSCKCTQQHYMSNKVFGSRPNHKDVHSTWLHNREQCDICHTAVLYQQFTAHTEGSLHVVHDLPVYYDQWWANCLVGSMANHTYFRVEKKPLLSPLSIESCKREEDSSDQQMTPKSLNEAFSVKATWQKPWKRHN